jgi:hypothetical protein
MNVLLPGWIPVAQQDPLKDIARELQGREDRTSGYLLTLLVVLVGIVVALWVLAKVLQRYEKRRPMNSSLMLFWRLCRVHRLRWTQRWLLWRVARDQQLKDPARLFLEPERLDPCNLHGVLRLRGAQLNAIRSRLFAGIPADEATSPEPAEEHLPAGPPFPPTDDSAFPTNLSSPGATVDG